MCASGPCSKSPFVRVICTKPDWDIRVYSYPPRSSPAWKKTHSLRYQSEQVNGLLKNIYGLGCDASRARSRRFFEAILAGVAMHVALWAICASPNIVGLLAARATYPPKDARTWPWFTVA